jgi:hypothetical protein
MNIDKYLEDFLGTVNPPIYDPYLLKKFGDFLYPIIKEKVLCDYLSQQVNHKIMMGIAEEYFTMIRNGVDDEKLKTKLNELSAEYSDDPAFCALLKLESISK